MAKAGPRGPSPSWCQRCGSGEEPPAERVDNVVGLVNNGRYLCCINVVVQSLFHVTAFRDRILLSPQSGPASGLDPCTRELASVFRLMSAGRKNVDCKRLLDLVDPPEGDGDRQGDAVEMWIRVLYALLDEAEAKEKASGAKAGGKPSPCIAFGGMQESKFFYADSSTSQGSRFMSFDIRCSVRDDEEQFHPSLEAALAASTAMKEIGIIEQDEDDADIEEDDPMPVWTQIGYNPLPKVMMIGMDRVSLQGDGGLKKLTEFVPYPERLDASCFSSDAGFYRLYGIFAHSGTVRNGHYVAFLRPGLGQWYEFDDENVKACDEREVFRLGAGSEHDEFTPTGFIYVREDWVSKVFRPCACVASLEAKCKCDSKGG